MVVSKVVARFKKMKIKDLSWLENGYLSSCLLKLLRYSQQSTMCAVCHGLSHAATPVHWLCLSPSFQAVLAAVGLLGS